MKLTYRGVHYDYTPPRIDLDGADFGRVRTSATHLTYRGVSHTQPLASAGMTPDAELTYRGVSYPIGSPAQRVATSEVPVEVAPVASAVVSAPEGVAIASAPVAPDPTPLASEPVSANDRARFLMMSHHRSVKLRQQTMLFRLATNLGVPAEEASHYWSSIQGKVQPSFWATYDRSHTSVS